MSKYVAILALLALMAMPAMALNTLYGQEGTTADGHTPINAAGQGPTTNPNSTNWQYQFGGTSTESAVYSWDTSAWVETVATDTDPSTDSNLDIECDIEMYNQSTIVDPKIYFHFGNLQSLNANDRTAYVNGANWSNHRMWVGLLLPGKVAGDIAADGTITDAMEGTTDIGGNDISAEAFDARIRMTYGAGYAGPDNFGDGAHNTIHDGVWWRLPSSGFFPLTWKIEMMPTTYQEDGNYRLDPVLAVSPEM